MGIARKDWLPLLIFLALATLRWGQCFWSGEADGWDGYYYVMQLNEWQESGRFHGSVNSLFYAPLLVFGTVFSPLLSYQLTVWLISVLFLVTSWFVLRPWLSKSNRVFAILLLGLSPHVLFFTLQFPKMLLAVSCLMLAVSALYWKKWRVLIPCILAVFLTHRAVFLVLMVIVPFCLHYNRKMIIIAMCTLLTIIAVLLVDLPFFPRIADLDRLQGQFTETAYWGVFEFYDIWGLFSKPSWFLEFILIHVFMIMVVLAVIKQKSVLRLVFPVLALLFLPVFTYISGSVGYRFQLLGVLLLLVFGMVALGRYRFAIPLVVCSLLVTNALMAYEYQLFNPPYGVYKAVALNAQQKLEGQHCDRLIAHKGVKEQIILQTELDALNWQPDTVTAHTYRVLAEFQIALLHQHLTEHETTKVHRLGYRYLLIPERLFDRKLREVVSVQQQCHPEKAWLNPIQRRPQFLR